MNAYGVFYTSKSKIGEYIKNCCFVNIFMRFLGITFGGRLSFHCGYILIFPFFLDTYVSFLLFLNEISYSFDLFKMAARFRG